MADIECKARALAGLTYEELCVFHDGAAAVSVLADDPAFRPLLGAEMSDRLEVFMVAVRCEVRARGIRPRFAASWEALDGVLS